MSDLSHLALFLLATAGAGILATLLGTLLGRWISVRRVEKAGILVQGRTTKEKYDWIVAESEKDS